MAEEILLNQQTLVLNWHFCEHCYPALIQAVFHVGDRFWTRQNQRPKNEKRWVLFYSFQDKFYSLKAHTHYFIVLMYLGTWKAAKLDIFIHFTSINLPHLSQSISSLMYVYYTVQFPSCFSWVLDHSCDCISSYYRRILKRFLYYFLVMFNFVITVTLCNTCLTL